MERKLRRTPWLVLGTLLLTSDLATAGVVGLRGSYEDVFVAVWGMVPAGTVVPTSARFEIANRGTYEITAIRHRTKETIRELEAVEA